MIAAHYHPIRVQLEFARVRTIKHSDAPPAAEDGFAQRAQRSKISNADLAMLAVGYPFWADRGDWSDHLPVSQERPVNAAPARGDDPVGNRVAADDSCGSTLLLHLRQDNDAPTLALQEGGAPRHARPLITPTSGLA